MRPCVALLHGYDPHSGLNADPEVSLIPTLDAREVAAVFTAPLVGFLQSNLDLQDGIEWYRGSWSLWHNENWRSKFFFFFLFLILGLCLFIFIFIFSFSLLECVHVYTWDCRTNHAKGGS